MTAPETGSMADHDDLYKAWHAVIYPDIGLSSKDMDERYEHMRAVAIKCGMPADTYGVAMWCDGRLAAYRAMMEKG